MHHSHLNEQKQEIHAAKQAYYAAPERPTGLTLLDRIMLKKSGLVQWPVPPEVERHSIIKFPPKRIDR